MKDFTEIRFNILSFHGNQFCPVMSKHRISKYDILKFCASHLLHNKGSFNGLGADAIRCAYKEYIFVNFI